MLPDFPEFKTEIHKRFRSRYQEYVNSQVPMMTVGRKRYIHEGDRYTYSTVDGKIVDGTPKLVESAFSVSIEQVPSLGMQEIWHTITEPAEDMAKQMSQHLMEVMDNAVAASGNVVNAEGKEFSPDLLLQVMSKIHIEFDSEGHPLLPTLLAHPELAAFIQRNKHKWEQDAGFDRRWDELILKKREEWRDRESNRALVD